MEDVHSFAEEDAPEVQQVHTYIERRAIPIESALYFLPPEMGRTHIKQWMITGNTLL